ncbi:hypothetical protein AB0B89_14390 [Sphaerisporangium sp. NPDC049002]|uniref:hypothetical protein n=1 Tax=unclassified Sphaerisporangium TaxID=2630420 RepID=UPI0033C45791
MRVLILRPRPPPESDRTGRHRLSAFDDKGQVIICAVDHSERDLISVAGMEADIAHMQTNGRVRRHKDPKGQVPSEMIRHRTERPRADVLVHVRRLTLAALVIAAAGALASPSQASASAVAGHRGSPAAVPADDHGHIYMRSGNGRFNKSYSEILSPTIITGLQNVSNTTFGGNSHTQSAACKKKHRFCNISQRARMHLQK